MSIKQIITRFGGRGVLLAQKYSPEILTTVGILGGVATAVMASKATLKVSDELEVLQDNINVVRTREVDEKYTPRDKSRDLAYIYTKNAIAVGKIYWPAISLGLASAASIVAAHGIMRRRNAALVAAYKTIESAFKEYRERVVSDLGQAKDDEYIYGKNAEVVRDADGNKEVVASDPTVSDDISIYARFFDEYSKNWNKQAEYNLMFLKSVQNYMNDLLNSRGHVFLNEVYDALGLSRSDAGQLVGWVLKRGENTHIDFGIYNFDSEAARAFVNGDERSILLDFNVDGVIFDKI